MPFDADDLSVFVDADMPSYVLASLTGGGTIDGLFGNGYVDTFGGLVGGTSPQLKVRKTTAVAIGDALTIGGVAYLIARIEPDQKAGFDLLILEKQ